MEKLYTYYGDQKDLGLLYYSDGFCIRHNHFTIEDIIRENDRIRIEIGIDDYVDLDMGKYQLVTTEQGIRFENGQGYILIYEEEWEC